MEFELESAKIETGDFFTRINAFVGQASPALLVLAGVSILALVAMGLLGKRLGLFFCLLLALSFSGTVWRTFDAYAVLMRWLVLALLAMNVLRARAFPGPAWMCYVAFVAIGGLWTIVSSRSLWNLQVAGLMIMVSLAGAALADYARDREKLAKVFTAFLVVGMVWTLMAMLGLPSLFVQRAWAHRFSGMSVSAPLFVTTGGLLLPFAVWGSMRNWRRSLKVLSGGTAAMMLVCLIVSGQRAGTFAAIIACLPLLMRREIRKLSFAGLALGAGLFLAFRLVSFNPQHAEFLAERYSSIDTTGRTELWRRGFEMCMQSPVVGAGLGSAYALVFDLPTLYYVATVTGFHNAYLSILYDTGIFGLMAMLMAFAWSAWLSLQVIRTSADEEVKHFARVLLGLTLALAALGFVENSVATPSTIATVVFVYTLTFVGGLKTLARSRPTQAVLWYRIPLQYPSAVPQ